MHSSPDTPELSDTDATVSAGERGADRSTDRRDLAAKIQARHQAGERRRKVALVAGCAVIGGGLLAAAAVPIWQGARDQARVDAQPLSSLGVAVGEAGCEPSITRPASGNNEHLPNGQRIDYPDAPPAFGPHYADPVGMERKFYTVADRPEVERLVHNLEHGFTIVWYDEDLAEDPAAMAALEDITKKFPATSGLKDKFLVAPWTDEDGAGFPDGANLALTHWSMGGTHGNPDGQVGVWKFCEQPSGAVVEQFVADYPFLDAPEGSVPAYPM